MGGKPSKGTPADKRLKENRPGGSKATGVTGMPAGMPKKGAMPSFMKKPAKR